MAERSDKLAGHVEATVEAIAQVHRDHLRSATALQRATDRLTAAVGRPGFILGFLVALLLWIGVNLWLARMGVRSPDPVPFAGLESFATVADLMIVLLILATQRREDRLAEQRSQLTLELALLNENKSAKIISLLEELRRDTPGIADRVDTVSDEMSDPAEPRTVLAAIEDRAGVGDQRKDGGQ